MQIHKLITLCLVTLVLALPARAQVLTDPDGNVFYRGPDGVTYSAEYVLGGGVVNGESMTAHGYKRRDASIRAAQRAAADQARLLAYIRQLEGARRVGDPNPKNGTRWYGILPRTSTYWGPGWLSAEKFRAKHGRDP